MQLTVGGSIDAPRARIVATIGPASATPAGIDALLAAGVDVARVNCAHGTSDSVRESIRLLRERAQLRGATLAVLADLAGPKLRIGRFAAGPIALRPGDRFTLTTEPVAGDAQRVSVSYPDLPHEVSPGATVSLNDGLIRLRVVSATETAVKTTVEVGGELSDRKGLSAPGVGSRLPSLTDKDVADLDVALAEGVDYLGLSFVRSQDDVLGLRREIARRGGSARIVAKIEKAEAVARIDRIAAAADAVMVARGDLGVECAIERIALLQKDVIATCRRLGTPVITATQMLESMVASPLPTRAEASDVANALLDGSDALMLSAETAMGRDPSAVVAMMRRIALATEEWARARTGAQLFDESAPEQALESAGAATIARAACVAAAEVGAVALACFTATGGEARALARYRPRVPILAVTASEATRRALRLVWGVIPLFADRLPESFDDACSELVDCVRRARAVDAGRRIVVTAGLPFPERESSNTLRVETV
ncbi:MAG TPA: pyruvate kinase [Candidatus Binatia bacterium]|nr:pyruvate kinase [Candidatus Binatia bacterium]